jgi:hypothetical protein
MKKSEEDLGAQLEVFNRYVSELNDITSNKFLKRLVIDLRSYLKKLDDNRYEHVAEYLYSNTELITRVPSGMDFGTNEYCRIVRSKQEINFILKNIIKDIQAEIDNVKVVSLWRRKDVYLVHY